MTIETTTAAALAEELRRLIDDLAMWREDESEALHTAAWDSAIMTLDRLAKLSEGACAPVAERLPDWRIDEIAHKHGDYDISSVSFSFSADSQCRYHLYDFVQECIDAALSLHQTDTKALAPGMEGEGK